MSRPPGYIGGGYRGYLARRGWFQELEGNWTLGMVRDTARTAIPPGGVYDALNVLLHKPGVAYKRGGMIQGTGAAGSGAGLLTASYVNFPGVGFQRIAVTGTTFLVDELTASSRVGHGTITGFTSIIDPPTLFVGGTQNVLVFCDSSGTKVPWFYNGGDDVQQFQGGNAGTTGTYSLAITGTPTGGSFKLAAQNLVSGFAYVTAAIAYNASAANVASAINAVATGATFITSGGSLPGTPVAITVPTDWAISYVPPAQSGVSFTGGTNPAGTIGQVGGTTAGVPTAIHSTSHLQRLILANSSIYPNRLWFGPLLNPTGAAWDTAESWIDMDDPVSGLVSMSGQLLVFSNEGMTRITGDTPPPDSNMDIQPMGHVGCSDARSIVQFEGQCMFANPRGVYVTTGIAPVALMQDRIETLWQSLFSGYNPLTWTISAGLYGRRWLFVSILNASDTLVKVFLCDLDRRAWVTVSQPRAKMYASAFGTEEELWAAEMDHSYLLKLSGVFTPTSANKNDAIGSIGFTLETRPQSYSTPVKAFGESHLSYDMRTAGDSPTIAVSTAPGVEAPTYTAVAESPLAATSVFTRKRITVNQDSECMSFRFVQTNSSASTEIYALETNVRSYSDHAEGT